MLNAGTSIQRMLRHSGQILKQPSRSNFAYYAARGSDSDALTYVAVASAITRVIFALSFGSLDVIAFLSGIVNDLFGFYIFAGISYFLARQMGRFVDFIQVCYGFALFYVPIRLLYAVLIALQPWLGLRFLAALPDALYVFVAAWPFWLTLIILAFYAYQAIAGIMRFTNKRDILICLGGSLVMYWLLMQVLANLTRFGSF